eukprot:1143400-Pelagomonas_calceolata.AAC.14
MASRLAKLISAKSKRGKRAGGIQRLMLVKAYRQPAWFVHRDAGVQHNLLRGRSAAAAKYMRADLKIRRDPNWNHVSKPG